MSESQRTTIANLRKRAQSAKKFAVLTCYDATTARLLTEGGIDVLLVGDSASQVILGHDQAIFAPLEFMLTITAAVRRGAPDALLMGDMPFMSYQADDAEAVRNAGRFLTQGQADVVKLEVDQRHAGLMEKLSRAGVPTVAHLGWRPQTVRAAGIRTARVAGRTQAEIDRVVDEARVMEQAGAAMLLLEQCTRETAEQVVAAVDLPVIGCGAGPACHGHVVVLQDALGMSDRTPSFVRPVGAVGQAIRDAAAQWVDLVGSGAYLRDDHPYPMNDNA